MWWATRCGHRDESRDGAFGRRHHPSTSALNSDPSEQPSLLSVGTSEGPREPRGVSSPRRKFQQNDCECKNAKRRRSAIYNIFTATSASPRENDLSQKLRSSGSSRRRCQTEGSPAPPRASPRNCRPNSVTARSASSRAADSPARSGPGENVAQAEASFSARSSGSVRRK